MLEQKLFNMMLCVGATNPCPYHGCMAAASQEGISPGNSQQLPVCAEMFLKELFAFVSR